MPISLVNAKRAKESFGRIRDHREGEPQCYNFPHRKCFNSRGRYYEIRKNYFISVDIVNVLSPHG